MASALWVSLLKGLLQGLWLGASLAQFMCRPKKFVTTDLPVPVDSSHLALSRTGPKGMPVAGWVGRNPLKEDSHLPG